MVDRRLRQWCDGFVSDELESQDGLSISAALCVDGDAFDRLGRVVRSLAVGLIDEAVHLRVLSSDQRVDTLSFGPVQTLTHQPVEWPWTRRRLRTVIEAVGQPPPTVVHALSAGSYRLAMAVAQVYDADVVFQVTSLDDCHELAQLDEKHVHAYLAFSKPLAQVLHEQLKAPAEQIELVRPGVLAAQRVACFAQPEYATTILCTSVFEKGSGVDQLIEALAILKKRGLEMLVFLLGVGRREPLLRRLAHDKGLSSEITFAYPLGDPADAMKSADLFVRPSADTAFTADTLQAMAVGSVVVTFPSSVCDFLRNGETALLCAEPTADSLAGTIEKLVTDPGYARQIAGAGMEYVRTHHTMSGMAERTAGVYRQLALARATFPIKE